MGCFHGPTLHGSVFPTLLIFLYIVILSMYHRKAGGPCCGWLWMEMVVYCTGAKQQQKKKIEKKTQKRKKKSQFRDGTICSLEAPDPFRSTVYFNCVIFVPMGIFWAPFCRTTRHPAQLVLNNCFPFLTTNIYKVEGALISIFFVLLRFMILCGLFCFLFAFTLFCILVCTLAALYVSF